MSKRAEESALKAYPICAVYNDLAMEYEDINGCYRVGFETGYEQAEKDLALTWEDVMFISQTTTKIINSLPDKPCPYTPGLKEICEETLKRFNEQRQK